MRSGFLNAWHGTLGQIKIILSPLVKLMETFFLPALIQKLTMSLLAENLVSNIAEVRLSV